MIDIVTGLFKIIQYSDKCEIIIANLVEVRGLTYIPEQHKLCMTKNQTILIMSS